MPPADDDRTRILLRRAAFLSGTLAAIGGCAQSRPAESPGSSPVVSVPESEPRDPEATDSPPPIAEPEPGKSDPNLPSLEMPGGIGDKGREQFQRLFDTVLRIHPLLDTIEKLVPDGCSVLDAKCEARWRELAAKQNELREIQTFMHSCPGSSPEAKLYAERENEHFAYIHERQKRIADRVQKTLDRDGKAGDERWARLQQDAYGAAPYPCLSIACQDW